MRASRRWMPSPAFVLALIALIAAVTGAAIAKSGGGRSVTKKQAANIANNQITQRAPGLSVDHAASAGKADSAGDASLVGGQRVVKVFAKLPSPTVSAPIANLGGGFTLLADCRPFASGGAGVNLAYSGTEGVQLTTQGNGDAGPNFDEDDTAGPTTFNLDFTNHRGELAFSAATTSGTVVSGTLGFEDLNSFDSEPVCSFYGQVVEG